MNSRSMIFLLLIIAHFSVFTQDKKAIKYAKTITTEDIRERLSVIASDEFEGRKTGELGQKKAAKYISDNFEAFGLTPPVKTSRGDSFLQEFKLYKTTYNKAYFIKNGEQKENLQDFLYYSRVETKGEEYIEVVYCGTIEDFDIRGLDLKGKFAAFQAEGMTGWRNKLMDLEKSEAAGYIIIVENENQYRFALSRFGASIIEPKIEFVLDETGTKTIIANKKLAEWIFDRSLERLKKGANTKLIFNADMLIEEIKSENVLGLIPGTDKADEFIVLSAHYDHLGIIDGKIYNGADDNASGISAIMEIAQAFKTASDNGDPPSRSILFIAFSGEEEGLLGSKYYVERPVVPLEKTTVDMNIDMIGRQDLKYSDNPDYVYVIGSDRISADLRKVSEATNQLYTNLKLDYHYDDINDQNHFYERSDHYNFALKGIPVIFYFNGTHGDYHRSTDTVNKINFLKIKKISDLIYYTAWEIANREESIRVK